MDADPATARPCAHTAHALSASPKRFEVGRSSGPPRALCVPSCGGEGLKRNWCVASLCP